MSADTTPGKKAVHVKWAGKTIALGTFSAQEAEEKCARAKALTRAWRSTVRPRPTREWVMEELERQGVRVVNGRLGRKESDDIGSSENGGNASSLAVSNVASSENRLNGIGFNPDTNVAGLLHTAARRNSSIGLSMLSDVGRNPLGAMESALLAKSTDSTNLQIPPHRPYKGGSAAAAYEAAFFDHCLRKNEEQQQRTSGVGNLPGSSLGGLASQTNPDQHYEMLKLHHMNLLNEIQETTLMMNLFQQQQQQQTGIASLNETGFHSNLGQLFNNSQMGQQQQQRPSLGFGGAQFGIGNLSVQQQLQQLQHQQLLLNSENANQANASHIMRHNQPTDVGDKRSNDDNNNGAFGGDDSRAAVKRQKTNISVSSANEKSDIGHV